MNVGNHCRYLYDLSTGKTIGIRKGEDTEEQSLSGKSVSIEPGSEPWDVDFDLLSDVNDISNINYGTVEDLPFETILNLYLSGNMTYDEFEIGIEAHGATISSGTVYPDKRTTVFLYNNKTYTVTCSYEASASQIDNKTVSEAEMAENLSVDNVYQDYLIYSAKLFVYQYFGIKPPYPGLEVGCQMLTSEQIKYVNSHPEIFHLKLNDNGIIDGGKGLIEDGGNFDSTLFGENVGNASQYSYEPGTFDMFGNGFPPGPDGSIPTGIDGMYVKQGKSDGVNGVYIYYYNAQTDSYDKVFHNYQAPIPMLIAGLVSDGRLISAQYPKGMLEHDSGIKDLITIYKSGHTAGNCSESERYCSLIFRYQQTSQDGLYYKDGNYYKFDSSAYSGHPLWNIYEHEKELFYQVYDVDETKVKVYTTPGTESIGYTAISNDTMCEELQSIGNKLGINPIGTCSDMSYDEYMNIIIMLEFLDKPVPDYGTYMQDAIRESESRYPDSWFTNFMSSRMNETDFESYKDNLPKFDKDELIQKVLDKLLNSPTLQSSVMNWDEELGTWGKPVLNPSLEKLLKSIGATINDFYSSSGTSPRMSSISFSVNGNDYTASFTPMNSYTIPESAVVTKEQVEILRNYVDENTFEAIKYWFFTPMSSVNGDTQTYLLTYNNEIKYFMKCDPLGQHTALEQVLDPQKFPSDDKGVFDIDFNKLLEQIKSTDFIIKPDKFNLFLEYGKQNEFNAEDFEATEVRGVFKNVNDGQYYYYKFNKEKGHYEFVGNISETQYQAMRPIGGAYEQTIIPTQNTDDTSDYVYNEDNNIVKIIENKKIRQLPNGAIQTSIPDVCISLSTNKHGEFGMFCDCTVYIWDKQTEQYRNIGTTFIDADVDVAGIVSAVENAYKSGSIFSVSLNWHNKNEMLTLNPSMNQGYEAKLYCLSYFNMNITTEHGVYEHNGNLYKFNENLMEYNFDSLYNLVQHNNISNKFDEIFVKIEDKSIDSTSKLVKKSPVKPEKKETETPSGARTVDFEEDETNVPETDETEEPDSVEETTEVKSETTPKTESKLEPEVLVDINTYKKQSEQEALKLGLSFDRKTRSFYKFQNGLRYNYILNPYKNNEKGGFEIHVAGQVKPAQDKKTVLVQMILAASNQNLDFTTILGICRDSDGNYYDYNEKQKVYVKR